MHSSRTFSFYPNEVVVNLTWYISSFLDSTKKCFMRKHGNRGKCLHWHSHYIFVLSNLLPLLATIFMKIDLPSIHLSLPSNLYSNIYNTYSKLRYHAVNYTSPFLLWKPNVSATNQQHAMQVRCGVNNGLLAINTGPRSWRTIDRVHWQHDNSQTERTDILMTVWRHNSYYQVKYSLRTGYMPR